MEIKQRMENTEINQRNKKLVLKEINKTDKILAMTEKNKMTQITKVKNERGDTTLSLTEIMKYYKRILCTNVCQYIR